MLMLLSLIARLPTLWMAVPLGAARPYRMRVLLRVLRTAHLRKGVTGRLVCWMS